MPQQNAVDAAELGVQLSQQPLGSELIGIPVVKTLVPDPGEEDGAAADRPLLWLRTARRCGKWMLIAPFPQTLPPERPVGRAAWSGEDLGVVHVGDIRPPTELRRNRGEAENRM